MKAGEICRVFTAAVLVIGFFSGASCWACLQSRSLGTAIIPAAWLILIAPAFLPHSYPALYVSDLPVWVSETKVGPECGALKGWWLTSLFLSQQGELSLDGKFPIGIKQCWFGVVQTK